MNRLLLFLACGLGLGWLPGAKGTYGTLLGVAYYLLLRQTANLGLYLAITAAGIALAVWLADAAEKILTRKDPREIVIDEIACFPVAMLGSEIAFDLIKPDWKFADNPAFHTGNLLIVFVLFRALDAIKPSFLRHAESQRGGWGIVLDDLLAALCAAAISALLLFGWFWFTSLPV